MGAETSTGRGPEWQRIQPEGHWDWSIPTPWTQGWRVGNMVFVGGQLSADENGNVVGEGDIELQTRNVFNNITTILDGAGATWNDVVRVNTYYCFEGKGDEVREYWEKMTRVRLEYLPDPGPVGTAVRVNGLMYDGFLIEVDCIAILPEGR